MNDNRYNGFINIYKEAGWTSMDVCARLRRILGMKKIGHAGTLDPMAEGVLPVALGRATRDVDRVGDGTKTYEAGMLLGLETDTEDITGKAVRTCSDDTFPSEEEIRRAVLSFVGPYEQKTPMYSARKVGGKKLYQYARAGIEVERKTRTVEILEIEILEITPPHVRFRVTCTKGTYIRTLCRDIGEMLGCGACMESLIRTRVGDFLAGNALKIADVESLEAEGAVDGALRIIAPTAVSIGKFDGTHMGHQALLKELKKVAQEDRLRTCVLILKFGSAGVLTDAERKRKLYGMDIDYCIELPFTEEMKNMSAEDFLEQVLIGRYHMKAIVAGDDVSFGKGKRGNAAFLHEHSEEFGYRVRLIEKVKIDFSNENAGAVGALIESRQKAASKESGSAPSSASAQDISSTLLREELRKGDMLHVTRLLGNPFTITGPVIHGRHAGTERMHFPTMNVRVPEELILPPMGVYAVLAQIADEKGSFENSPVLQGIANLGTRPTVDSDGTVMLETHTFGDSYECYGRMLRVGLCFYIRPEEKFDSLEALKASLETKDIPAVESFFGHI